MRFDTPTGSRLRFTGLDGLGPRAERALARLRGGRVYTLEEAESGPDGMAVRLLEAPGEAFDGAMFETIEETADQDAGGVLRTSIAQQSQAIEAWKAANGIAGRDYVPLNSGAGRTEAKRRLLQSLAEAAAASGETPPFTANFEPPERP